MLLFLVWNSVFMVLVFSVLSMLVILSMTQIFFSDAYFTKSSTLTSLESGFESLNTVSLVSTPYFFLAMIFVLFDLEMFLLFPGVLNVMTLVTVDWSFMMTVIIMTLSLEWLCCGLKWQV